MSFADWRQRRQSHPLSRHAQRESLDPIWFRNNIGIGEEQQIVAREFYTNVPSFMREQTLFCTMETHLGKIARDVRNGVALAAINQDSFEIAKSLVSQTFERRPCRRV